VDGFKVLREADRQILRSSGVLLIEDYTSWFHISP
jgi:hypothetical protein